jgi:xanthine/CO dehydrogenase XdhC/CoxF family maturation factor
VAVVEVEDLVEDLLDDLDNWRRQDLRVAIARVVDLDGRPDHPAGGERNPLADGAYGPVAPAGGDPHHVPERVAMAVNERGEIVGARWAGCAEGAVVAAALDVLRHDRARLVSIGHSGDQAYSMGLAAGGTVHVLLEPLHW